jgi:MoxR-like ATPase
MKTVVKEQIVAKMQERYGAGSVISKQQVLDVSEMFSAQFPSFFFLSCEKAGRGKYIVPASTNISRAPAAVVPVQQLDSVAALSPNTLVANMNVQTTGFTENLIPEKDPLFVPFGNFATVKEVIGSKLFYPVFITGLSGNGKTFSVEQACASLKREVIRVNFTAETDEDDLIGGFRLVNGETKFFKGPVIKAMERGAILLLDEIDLGTNKIMCLQSILEGKGYFIKKTGEYINPKAGFNVVATANTKGKGSTDGRFIGTNILNEAFLERFPITCEQEYPSVATEKKIVGKLFEQLEINDSEFVEKLVDWADIIRKTFFDGGVDEIISTRRLVHIGKAYKIFGKRDRAIDMCIARFDEDTKLSFRDLYSKIDSSVDGDVAVVQKDVDQDIPF